LADCRYRSESALRNLSCYHGFFGETYIMPNYRRNFVPGGTYFFTVTLLERRRDLLVKEIDLLRNSVRRVKWLYPFEIVA
jgi:putative transposase